MPTRSPRPMPAPASASATASTWSLTAPYETRMFCSGMTIAVRAAGMALIRPSRVVGAPPASRSDIGATISLSPSRVVNPADRDGPGSNRTVWQSPALSVAPRDEGLERVGAVDRLAREVDVLRLEALERDVADDGVREDAAVERRVVEAAVLD